MYIHRSCNADVCFFVMGTAAYQLMVCTPETYAQQITDTTENGMRSKPSAASYASQLHVISITPIACFLRRPPHEFGFLLSAGEPSLRGSINLELAKPYAGCQPCFNLRLLHCLTLLLDRVLNVCHVSLEIGMRFANAMVRNAAVCDRGHLGGGGGAEGRLGRGRVVINKRTLTVCRKRENTD